MKHRFLLLALCFLSIKANLCFAEAQVRSRLENYSAYFLTQDFLRHNRWEITLHQMSPISQQWHAVAEVRARMDLGVTPIPSGQNYDPRIWNDELFEAEPRRLALDYMGDTLRAKVGLIQIDWTESIFPYVSNLLSPLDLRHGAFGVPDQTRLPVVAVDINQRIGNGTLNWILIPTPRSHRFPAASNSFGYYETLTNLVSPATVTLNQGSIPRKFEHIEAGIRYWMRWDSLEITPLFFWHHQRNPVHTVNITGTAATITQSYPRLTTLGFTSNYGYGDWILRFSTLFQPKRMQQVILNPPPNTVYEERLIQTIIGFDYVFSKHLKIYSEFSSSWKASSTVNTLTSVTTPTTTNNDHVLSARLTNESLEDILFTLEFVYSFPETSYLFSPQAKFDLSDNTQLSLGVRHLVSNSTSSPLEYLKDTDHVFMSLVYHFSIN